MALAMMFMAPGSPIPLSPSTVGVASRFGDPGDKWVGGNLYCAPKKRVDSKEHVCAHRRAGYRELPCGSILILENPRTGKRSWCKVMDRGPYGANVLSREPGEKYTQVYTFRRGKHRKQWYVKISSKTKIPEAKCPSGDCIGRWRGYLDMSPAVSNDLGHNGMERIKSWRLDRLVRYLKHKREKREKQLRRKNAS